MPKIEGIRDQIGALRRAVDVKRYPERHWDASLSQAYITSLARGEHALLSSSEYPHSLALHPDWHSVFNSMREETGRDGHERWAMIAYKAERTGIYLPTVNVKGGQRDVSGELQSRQRMHAQIHHGIAGTIGDIHSHPRMYGKPEDFIAFSSADLYNLVTYLPDRELMLGLVEGDNNMLAFASRTTKEKVTPAVWDQTAFIEYWEKRFNPVSQLETNLQEIFPGFTVGTRVTEPYFDFGLTPKQIIERDNAIAQRHDLVFFIGRKDNVFIQSFPQNHTKQYATVR